MSGCEVGFEKLRLWRRFRKRNMILLSKLVVVYAIFSVFCIAIGLMNELTRSAKYVFRTMGRDEPGSVMGYNHGQYKLFITDTPLELHFVNYDPRHLVRSFSLIYALETVTNSYPP